VSIVENYFMII